MSEDWVQRIKEIQGCRICGNRALAPVIDLGFQSLAGLFDDGQPYNQLDTPIPLEVVRCDATNHPGACGFVQLKHTAPPEVMFRDYGYRSGINATMRRHLQDLASQIGSKISLTKGDIVVDIGANDGTMLLAYPDPEVVRVGFEPSDVRPENDHHGIHYIPSFFNRADFHAAFPGKKAKVVTSIAMFYDIDDPIHFCQEVSDILSDDGFWVIELGYLGTLLENNGFDAICHEHLGYYSLNTLAFLSSKTGFVFYDISFNQANGGSVRCTLVKKAGHRDIPRENQERINLVLGQELERAVHQRERYREFQGNVKKIKQDLMELLELALARGEKIYGYGASTKGNVLLQYCGISPRHLVAIADRNPAKWGRRAPGTHIPICSEDQMRQAKPDALLILPWHFLGEFLEREKLLRSGGTKFIVPFPKVRLV